VVRSRLLVVLLVALAGACDSGVGSVTDALTPSASASPSPPASPSPEPTSGGRPAIVVRTPASGDEVTSPVRIAGTANVFEATVSVVLLDAAGQELAATFATATCGSGCRGRFATALSFFTDVRQAGTIEAFESSAEDGTPLHLVSIPVVLVPGS
jgi:hypothetical protein